LDGDWFKYYILDSLDEEICILIKDGINGREVVFNFDRENTFPADSDLEYDSYNTKMNTLMKWIDDNEELLC
jgi:hypothetical protein